MSVSYATALNSNLWDLDWGGGHVRTLTSQWALVVPLLPLLPWRWWRWWWGVGADTGSLLLNAKGMKTMGDAPPLPLQPPPSTPSMRQGARAGAGAGAVTACTPTTQQPGTPPRCSWFVDGLGSVRQSTRVVSKCRSPSVTGPSTTTPHHTYVWWVDQLPANPIHAFLG